LGLCSDGRDNDGDGFTDFPSDPGCAGVESTMENPKCQDGVDNDHDGWIDFDGGASAGVPQEQQTEADPQCGQATRNRERCGLGFEIVFVLAPMLWWRNRRKT
jgi:hypothetical protein